MADKIAVVNMRPGWEYVGEGSARGGLASTVSWSILEDMLKETGQLKPGEYVRRFEVNPHGVTFYIENE